MRTLITHSGKVPLYPGKIVLTGELPVPPPITFTYSQSCCAGGGLLGCINLYVNGDNAPFSYQWDSNVGFSATVKDLFALINGTYWCVITDNIGNTQSTGDIVINCP
jgi:hypothetical protein